MKPSQRSYSAYIERAKRIAQRLQPVKAEHTTSIENCDFAFKCPMLVDDLELVSLGLHGSGPVFFCAGCNEHVYTVKTQAAKEAMAAQNRCVVFSNRDTVVGAGVRVLVALVTEDDDEEEGDGADKSESCAQQAAHRAMCEIRAYADWNKFPSSVALRIRDQDSLVVTMSTPRSVTADFRHIRRSQLYDKTRFMEEQRLKQQQQLRGGASASAAAAAAAAASASAVWFSHSSSSRRSQHDKNSSNKPFIPDVVVSLQPEKIRARQQQLTNSNPAAAAAAGADADDVDIDALVASNIAESSFGVSITNTHLCVCAVTDMRASTRGVFAPCVLRSPLDPAASAASNNNNSCGDTTPIAFFFDPADREWKFGFEAVIASSKFDPALLLDQHAATIIAITSAAALQHFLGRHSRLDKYAAANKKRLDDGTLTGIYIDATQSQGGATATTFDVAVQCWMGGQLVATTSSLEMAEFMFTAIRYLVAFAAFNFNDEQQQQQRSTGRFGDRKWKLAHYLPAVLTRTKRSSARDNNNNNNSEKNSRPPPQIAMVFAYPSHQVCLDAERTRWKHLAQSSSNISVIRILSPSSAATICDGVLMRHSEQQNHNSRSSSDDLFHLVLHIGSTTSTVCVMCLDGGIMEILSTSTFSTYDDSTFASSSSSSDTNCCGRHFDDLLAEHVLQSLSAKNSKNAEDRVEQKVSAAIRASTRSMRRLRAACEIARRALSSSVAAAVQVEDIADGFDVDVPITRARLESLVEEPLKNFCLHAQGLVAQHRQITALERVMLTGGVCKMPKLRALLLQSLNTLSAQQTSGGSSSSSGTNSNNNNNNNNNASTTGADSTAPANKIQFQFHPSHEVACGAALQSQLLGTQFSKQPRPLVASYIDAARLYRLVSMAATSIESENSFMGMLNVMPLTLSVGDASTGLAIPIVKRNSMVPTEKSLKVLASQLHDVYDDDVVNNNSTNESDSCQQQQQQQQQEHGCRKKACIFQGERSNIDHLSFFCACELPLAPRDSRSEIEVSLFIDANDIVHVYVDELGATPPNFASIVLPSSTSQPLSRDDIDEMLRAAEKFAAEDALLKEMVVERNRLEVLCYEIRRSVDEEQQQRSARRERRNSETVKKKDDDDDDDDDVGEKSKKITLMGVFEVQEPAQLAALLACVKESLAIAEAANSDSALALTKTALEAQHDKLWMILTGLSAAKPDPAMISEAKERLMQKMPGEKVAFAPRVEEVD